MKLGRLVINNSNFCFLKRKKKIFLGVWWQRKSAKNSEIASCLGNKISILGGKNYEF